MVTELIEYLKDKNRNKVGVMVGIKREDGTVSIGISRCRPDTQEDVFPNYFREGDVFNKQMGLTIARGRAIKGKCAIEIFNPAQHAQIIKFTGRCLRYFTKTDGV